MKKKKVGSILMAGLMACSITAGLAASAGCGGSAIKAFEMPEGGFDMTKKVTIQFNHTMGADLAGVVDEFIPEFNKLFPNIEVKHEQVGDYKGVLDRTKNEINAGSGTHPDVVYCYPDHVAEYNRAKAVLPLNDFLPDGQYANMKLTLGDGSEGVLGLTQAEKDAFIKGYYDEGFKFGDEKTMYTLPFSKSTEVLFYNKTFFEANNLQPPKTWDEMETLCRKIREIDPTCTAPLGYDSEDNWFINMCEQQGSGYTTAEGKFIFDNEPNRKFVERIKKWYDDKLVTTKGMMSGKYTSDIFKIKKSYMSIGSSAGATKQAPTDGSWEVGITSIPQVNPDNPKVISQGPSVCVLLHDDPQRVLASWLFVKYFTTNVAFQASFASKQGYVSVLKTVADYAPYKQYLDKADGFKNIAYLSAKVCMEQESAYYTSPAFIGSAVARQQVGLLIQNVLNGSSISEAFDFAIKECKFRS